MLYSLHKQKLAHLQFILLMNKPCCYPWISGTVLNFWNNQSTRRGRGVLAEGYWLVQSTQKYYYLLGVKQYHPKLYRRPSQSELLNLATLKIQSLEFALKWKIDVAEDSKTLIVEFLLYQLKAMGMVMTMMNLPPTVTMKYCWDINNLLVLLVGTNQV